MKDTAHRRESEQSESQTTSKVMSLNATPLTNGNTLHTYGARSNNEKDMVIIVGDMPLPLDPVPPESTSQRLAHGHRQVHFKGDSIPHATIGSADTLGPADTLGYFKSTWQAEYPQKEAEYLRLKEDTNTTCCGVNVIEIGQQISRYNSEILNSPWKICCCFPGSFCFYLYQRKLLILEELIYVAIFFVIVSATLFNRYNLIPNVIVEYQSLGTLVTFFLALYVSLSVARWWRLRTDGVGNIWSASSGLATLLGPAYEVYRDKVYRDASSDSGILKEGEKSLQRILIHLKRIQRYCQLSMAMVFNQNGQEGFDFDHLEELEIITQEDRDSIENLGSRQEYMWSLVSREVRIMMEECPRFMDSNLVLTVQQLICKGRSGAGLIAAQLGTQLPLTYAHGVTLMGKLYNIVVCVTSGISFVDLWLKDMEQLPKYAGHSHSQIVFESPIIFAWNVSAACLFLLVKTTSISLLLTLCQQLANPFDNDIMAFPGLRYVKWIYLDFEILLGFDIKKQWERIRHDYYKYSSKERELEDLVHMAQDCGILWDSERQKSLKMRKSDREQRASKKNINAKNKKCCCNLFCCK